MYTILASLSAVGLTTASPNISSYTHSLCRYETAAEEYKEAVKSLMNIDDERENPGRDIEDKVQKITGILSKQTLDTTDKESVPSPVGKMNFFVNEVGLFSTALTLLVSEWPKLFGV